MVRDNFSLALNYSHCSGYVNGSFCRSLYNLTISCSHLTIPPISCNVNWVISIYQLYITHQDEMSLQHYGNVDNYNGVIFIDFRYSSRYILASTTDRLIPSRDRCIKLQTQYYVYVSIRLP